MAEFTFQGDGFKDFYDGQSMCYLLSSHVLMRNVSVSLVDGYNLPMRIDNTKGCGIASCPVDLGPNCA